MLGFLKIFLGCVKDITGIVPKKDVIVVAISKLVSNNIRNIEVNQTVFK